MLEAYEAVYENAQPTCFTKQPSPHSAQIIMTVVEEMDWVMWLHCLRKYYWLMILSQ